MADASAHARADGALRALAQQVERGARGGRVDGSQHAAAMAELERAAAAAPGWAPPTPLVARLLAAAANPAADGALAAAASTAAAGLLALARPAYAQLLEPAALATLADATVAAAEAAAAEASAAAGAAAASGGAGGGGGGGGSAAKTRLGQLALAVNLALDTAAASHAGDPAAMAEARLGPALGVPGYAAALLEGLALADDVGDGALADAVSLATPLAALRGIWRRWAWQDVGHRRRLLSLAACVVALRLRRLWRVRAASAQQAAMAAAARDNALGLAAAVQCWDGQEHREGWAALAAHAADVVPAALASAAAHARGEGSGDPRRDALALLVPAAVLNGLLAHDPAAALAAAPGGAGAAVRTLLQLLSRLARWDQPACGEWAFACLYTARAIAWVASHEGRVARGQCGAAAPASSIASAPGSAAVLVAALRAASVACGTETAAVAFGSPLSEAASNLAVCLLETAAHQWQAPGAPWAASLSRLGAEAVLDTHARLWRRLGLPYTQNFLAARGVCLYGRRPELHAVARSAGGGGGGDRGGSSSVGAGLDARPLSCSAYTTECMRY
jgi:trimeric autotransporter adhesin